MSFPPVRRPELQRVDPALMAPADTVTQATTVNGSETISPLPCPTDTVYIIKVDTVWVDVDHVDSIYLSDRQPSRYDRRVDRFRRGWAALIPTHLKLQYAGNMGLLSVGFGWDYGKKSQWETDLYFGYLPKFGSDRNKITFTLKQNYIPWSVQIKQGPLSFEPLTCGIYFNTVFGDEFWVHEPDRYPSGGYYRFSSKIRIHVFMGERLTLDIPERLRHIARQVTLFYEFSTCDLYIISAFTNKYLKPKDYLSLSFGLKLQLL